MRVLMVCLGKPENAPNDLLKLLDTLLVSDCTPAEKCKTLEVDFDIPMTAKLEKEVSDMGNLGDFVEARGIEKGIQWGEKNGKLQSLQNLMDSMKWTFQQAMDLLDIPNGERNKYAHLVEQGNV